MCAMPMEVRPIVKKLSLRRVPGRRPPLYRGVLGARRVAACVTGMGTELATAGMEALFADVDVALVVVVGITGAVEDETPIGTLVLPETVVNGASGARFRPAALGRGTPRGTMWTTDVLTTDLDLIAGLRASGVVALDMETAAIAEACEKRGVPWSVFRVISDRATDGSVDEEVFRLSNQDGSPNWAAVGRYVVRHPGRLARMARLAKNAGLATTAAADAAIDAVSMI